MNTIKNKIALVILILSIIPSIKTHAQANKLVPPEKPKLIIGIIVTQFRQDYITRYWDKFSDDGIKKLISRGANCKNASYNYLLSDKGVGTATIVTGANPSDHGIVSDSWYDDLKGKIIPSVSDEAMKTVGGPYDAGQYSPQYLLSTTFSDELNLTNNFKSKVIGVSLEPTSAILSAGHTATAAYWLDIQNGNFLTSTFYMDSLPRWVNDFNSKRIPDIYLENEWNTLYPLTDYTESLPDNSPFEEGYNNGPVFPYKLKEIAKNYKKKEIYNLMNAFPFGDNLVKDFAIQVIANENLGKDDATDILYINFTALEQIGNMFGPLSVEVEDAVLRLDKELAHFLSFVENEVGLQNTLVFFTAEHGVAYKPEYLETYHIPSGYFNSKSAISLLSSYLNNIYGKGDWIKLYNAQQIYLNRTLIESAKIPLSDFQESAANLMLQFEGIQNTLTSSSLLSTSYNQGVFQKIQNGYNQKRSGDIILNLKNGWVDKVGKEVASFGTDNRIPLVFYGWKVGRKTIVKPVNLTDIAPTLSVMLEISYPNASVGVPIMEVIQ